MIDRNPNLAQGIEEPSDRWWRWPAVALVAAGLALSGPYAFAVRLTPSGVLRLTPTPGRAVAYWISWLLAVPVLVIAGRYAIIRRPSPARLLLHIGLAVLASALHAAAFELVIRKGWVSPFGRPKGLPPSLYLETVRGLWDYALFLAVIHVAAYARSLREQARAATQQELRQSQLEAEVARAEVSALQSQLQPHFLFNTLNSIAVLATQDPAAARNMVLQLGALLRAVTQQSRDSLVPLRRELDIIDRYLAIQRMRFHDHLLVEMQVEDDAFDAVVPSMTLQPLVENAIRYTVERAGTGRIVIAARRVDDDLVLSVEDEGARDDAPPTPGTGVGLDNIRRRLALLFGDQFRLELKARVEGGIAASIVIPYRVVA